MQDLHQRAEDELREALALISGDSLHSFGPRVRTALDILERDPLLGPLLAAVPEPTAATLLYNHHSAPANADEWGIRAYAFMRYVRDRSSDWRGKQVFGELRLDSHSVEKVLYGDTRTLHKEIVETAYVQPIVRWLRRAIRDGSYLQVLVERWIRRTQWLGIPSLPPVGLDEDSLQVDLHRHLFDGGIDFRESGREHPSGRGEVDFLIRGSELVAVELKVWRDEGPAALRKWFEQAQRYPRDFAIRKAYLIIAFRDTKSRLVLAPALQPPRPIVWHGMDVHVRTVDISRPGASADRRRAITLNAALLTGFATPNDGSTTTIA